MEKIDLRAERDTERIDLRMERIESQIRELARPVQNEPTDDSVAPTDSVSQTASSQPLRINDPISATIMYDGKADGSAEEFLASADFKWNAYVKNRGNLIPDSNRVSLYGDHLTGQAANWYRDLADKFGTPKTLRTSGKNF